MDSTLYKIIFNGDVVPRHDVERVKNNLAALFGASASSLDSLFQGRLVVIKKGLSLEDADRYREAVERVGGYCIIERIDEPAKASVINLNARVEKMACPKCHAVQPKMPVCSACGVIVEEFRKRIAADRDAVVAIFEGESREKAGVMAAESIPNTITLDTDSERSPAPSANPDS